jgi:predicted  nucleic acid-binding Zn-ribbon protein
MFLPSFRHLIEIEALKTLSQIEQMKFDEKSLNLPSLLETLSVQETRLKKLNVQLSLAVTEKEQVAFENQIKLIKIEIEKSETEYFSNLETSESLLSEIEDKNTFLKGSLETLEEIRSDADQNISIEQKAIDNRDLRINSLMDLIHPSLKSIYLELQKSFKTKNAVSYLIDKKCSECHMQADSILKNSLEEGRSIEMCPSCGRLLIPETAKIY